MTLEEIYNKNDLSIRTYNICKYNELLDINAILAHYAKYNTFSNLRNCGTKSDIELKALCDNHIKLKDKNELIIIDDKIDLFKNIIDNLSITKRQLINTFIHINTSNLSNRSRNAISFYLEYNFKVKNFYEKILGHTTFKIEALQNIGDLSIKELSDYIETIKKFIANVYDNENIEEINKINIEYLLKTTFTLSDIPADVLSSNSIFKISHFLIYSKSLFEKKINDVINKTIKISQFQADLTFEDISKELRFTKERIRQIRSLSFDKLFEKLMFLKNIEEDLYKKYNIETEEDFIWINTEIANNINQINQTDFTPQFITYILSSYLSSKFDLLGNLEDTLFVKQINSRSRHNWRNIYLIKKEIKKLFDFEKLIEDIDSRLNEKIEETYKFNFKSYLSNFLIEPDFLLLDKITGYCEKIINEELNLIVDIEDNILFKRNTLKQLPEYIEEILETEGEPLSIESIFDILESKYPGLSKSAEAMRGSCQRSEKLIYFGRSSTYGLKKWEVERNDIKGGTIKDLIIDYLKTRESPIHVSELLEEIHKYRPTTNTKSILTNLKLDPQKQFIIYNQSFVGLKTKNYNSNLTSLPKLLGKEFVKHIKDNEKIISQDLISFFSEKLKISTKNTSYILHSLIENETISITPDNELKYENTRN